MGLYRKVIHISATHTPNILEAIRRIKEGTYPPHELLVETEDRPGFFTRREYEQLKARWEKYEEAYDGEVPYKELETVTPGVVSYADYLRRLVDWDEATVCSRIFGNFYEGSTVLLYPVDWLDKAEVVAEGGEWRGQTFPGLERHRHGASMGIDAAEGGDNTSWAIVDHLGLVHLFSCKTPDTSEIPTTTITLGREWRVPDYRWVFDLGGGGKEHMDALRKLGYDAKGVLFSESASPPPKRSPTGFKEGIQNQEIQSVYMNRRAEMYGALRNLLNPALNPGGFGLPPRILNRKRDDGGPSLRDQLKAIPLKRDNEGRLRLPPKNRRSGSRDSLGQPEECLVDILGCSPDEADSVALAVHGFKYRPPSVAGQSIG